MGHSIYNLLSDLEKLKIIPSSELKNIAKELDTHYITSRYPDSKIKKTPKKLYTKNKAKRIKKKVKNILNFIETKKIEVLKNEK